MGKLKTRLDKQLTTEYKKDAEDCILIYNTLLNRTGKVWSSQWTPLVTVIFLTYPSRRYKPTSIGYTFLKGLISPVEKKTYSRDEHLKGIKRMIQLYETTYLDGNIDDWIKKNL